MHDLNDMYYFAEVVERGGFAAAGRALGIPKSRLSRRISEMEGRLGVRLLQRTTRRLSLTDAGETYLRHCLSVREAAQSAQAAIEQTQREPSGIVRMSCPVNLAQGVVGALIPEFLRRYSKVRLELMVSNRVINLLEDGVDVALRVRASLDDSGSLIVKRLGMTRQILVASPELIAIYGEPKVPHDLVSAIPVLGRTMADGNATMQLQKPDSEPVLVHYQPRYVADDFVTLKHAVLNGVGVYWMPDYMVQGELARGDLVEVLPDWAMPEGIFHAAFASRRNMAPALRVLIDFLAEKLPTKNRGSTTWPVLDGEATSDSYII